MQLKQRIYAAVLGVLSLILIVAWTIQAINLADGTYTEPLTEGWVLFVYLVVSPFTTGFTIALNKSEHLLFTILRGVMLAQIPLFALTLCASTVGLELILQSVAAGITMLSAVCGVAVAGRAFYESSFLVEE